MNAVREEARDVPVVHECDVCVIGGSCTGVFAAITAARLGARAAVVERHGCFGGTATSSLVNCWHSTFDLEGRRQIIAGMTVETMDRLKRRHAVTDRGNELAWQYAFNSAELAIELDELVKEGDVRPFLHAHFAAPVVEGDRMTAAIIEDKTGRRAIRAAMFVDATGDADAAARAGAGTRIPDDLQPPTCAAIVRGVQAVSARVKGFDLGAAVCDPAFPEAIPPGFLWHAPIPGLPDMRMVAGTRVSGANCADADELTAAEIEGRRQARAICDVLRRHFPGGEEVALAALPARIGIRETRHVECMHTLTETEVLNGTRFDDAIANGTYRVDVHHSGRPGLTFRYLDGREVYAAPGRPPEESRWRAESEGSTDFYQIPLRCLVPREGPGNLIAAGRALDADRGAFGAARVMVNCNQTGEAAGAAAWAALDGDTGIREVEAARVRDALTRLGAIVI